MLANRITCLIGAYTAEMEGVDVLVFTGGIGENAAPLRERVLGHFSYLGLEIDRDANGRNDTVITGSGSRVTAMVIPANEELQITREIVEVMRGSERP
jgi:acetate kinase